MKARTVRKLRKQLNSFETFEVSLYHCKHDEKNVIKMIKAENYIHALKRYLKWYWRHFKEKPEDLSHHGISETTKKFGSFIVTNSKGFKRYYN
jgi:hypothetical protein